MPCSSSMLHACHAWECVTWFVTCVQCHSSTLSYLLSQVEELILGNLEQLAREGFTSTAIEAAVNTIEFSLRENNTGSFPRGLSLMLRSMAAWIYDRDPLEVLQWTDDLQRFKVFSSCACHCGDMCGPLHAMSCNPICPAFSL